MLTTLFGGLVSHPGLAVLFVLHNFAIRILSAVGEQVLFSSRCGTDDPFLMMLGLCALGLDWRVCVGTKIIVLLGLFAVGLVGDP